MGASVKNVLLVLGVNAIGAAVPFTPQGAGVTQALLVKVFAGSAAGARRRRLLGRPADRDRAAHVLDRLLRAGLHLPRAQLPRGHRARAGRSRRGAGGSVCLGSPQTLAIAVVAAVAIGVIAGHSFPDYDATFALIWGHDLAHGQGIDYGIPLRPGGHPLTTATATVLSVFGRTRRGRGDALDRPARRGRARGRDLPPWPGPVRHGGRRAGRACWCSRARRSGASRCWATWTCPRSRSWSGRRCSRCGARARGASVLILLALAGPGAARGVADGAAPTGSGSPGATAAARCDCCRWPSPARCSGSCGTRRRRGTFLGSIHTAAGAPVGPSSGGHGLGDAPRALARFLGGFVRPPEAIAAAAGIALALLARPRAAAACWCRSACSRSTWSASSGSRARAARSSSATCSRRRSCSCCSRPTSRSAGSRMSNCRGGVARRGRGVPARLRRLLARRRRPAARTCARASWLPTPRTPSCATSCARRRARCRQLVTCPTRACGRSSRTGPGSRSSACRSTPGGDGDGRGDEPDRASRSARARCRMTRPGPGSAEAGVWRARVRDNRSTRPLALGTCGRADARGLWRR